MIIGIEHIGIAVTSIEEARKLYSDVFGLEVGETEPVEEQQINVAWIPVGNTKIELLESTDPEGPIAKHIERRGEGIHHLALEVRDIQDALEILKEKGIQLVDEKPRGGYGGARVAFLHPKGTRKVLIELVEH